MKLPWPLLWLIDPAGAYWARHTPEPDGPVYRGGAVFGPDVPGGSRQATGEEIEAMALWGAPRVADHGESVACVERRWGRELGQAADRLLAEGTASLRRGGRSVEARLVRFWRGDSLLETSTSGPRRGGGSRTRISRRAAPEDLTW